MADVREATAEFLAEKPDLEEELREVLAVDAGGDPWGFHDVPVDSGAFGELVSRGIVEKRDGGYRVSDPGAVRAGLSGEAVSGDAAARVRRPSLDVALPALAERDRPLVGALAGALALVVAFRLVAYPAVFRNGDVVLSGNDPYFYRYWVETVAARSAGPLDVGVLSTLPSKIADGEPLMVATLWWVTELLGGSARAAGLVLAWYPVVSAVVVGAVVYVLATRLFDDRRVGLAAVAMFAITPVNGFRSGLGFADHHAFDYPWLVLTVLALVLIAGRERPSREAWAGAGLLGVAVAGGTLAWDASPLLVGAVGLYLVLGTLSEVRADDSPLGANAPLLVGLLVAAAVAALAHATLGWHAPQVAYAPALLLAGGVAVVAVAEAVHRLSLSAAALVGVDAVGAIVGWFAFQAALPAYAARLAERLGVLLGNREAVETIGLFAGGLGVVVGPIILFGFVLFLGLAALAWASWWTYREHRPSWLVACTYGWYFFALSLLQIRFAGELAPVIAPFAGLAFVSLAAKIDAARPPAPLVGDRDGPPNAGNRPRSAGDGPRSAGDGGRAAPLSLPDRRTAVNLALLFLLVGSYSFVQTPVKTGQLTVPAAEYRAAVAMRADAAERGLTYPDNYVLSRWDDSRSYNYFVNGQSRSYGFARGAYVPFLFATDGEKQYRRLAGHPTGYVVTQEAPALEEAGPDTLYVRLHRHLGSRTPDAPGLAHYRAVFVSGDGSVKAFALVPGATVNGSLGEPGRVETIATTVRVDGETFTYERRLSTGKNGAFRVTVPYPGEYTLADRTIRVTGAAVEEGRTIEVEV